MRRSFRKSSRWEDDVYMAQEYLDAFMIVGTSHPRVSWCKIINVDFISKTANPAH